MSSRGSGRLLGVPTEEHALASVLDPDGREVLLLARVWNDKIALDHPEVADHLEAVMQAVEQPDHREPDDLPRRTRFYRRNVGPSRWLLAVLSYEQEPARHHRAGQP